MKYYKRPTGGQLMSKTTALTFTAAIVLFAACVTASVYGHRIAAERMSTLDGYYTIYDADLGLDSWEQASVFTGLLGVALTFAGALLWDRETQSPAQRVSVLGLDGRAGRRIFRTAAPLKIVAATIQVDENCAQLYEEESLTPLERVIRSY